MKKLLGFLFGYGARGTGHLGWSTRLSQPDHLYHQGRNFLSMVIYGAFLLVMLFALAFVGGIIAGALEGIIPSWVGMTAMIVIGSLLLLPMFYLSFATFKLTVMRLHDFGLSGWWILYSLILGVMDFCFDTLFPGFTFFLSMQSLVYLGLLVWPAPSAEPNAYGDAAINSTAGKQRWIRAVPIVIWVFTWLAGMVTPFADAKLQAAQEQSMTDKAEFEAQRAYLENLGVMLATSGTTPVSTTSNVK